MNEKNMVLNNIKDKVHKQGKTISDIEDYIGVQKGFLKNLTGNEMLDPSSKFISLIARELKCSESDLFQPIVPVTDEEKYYDRFLNKLIAKTNSGELIWHNDEVDFDNLIEKEKSKETRHPIFRYIPHKTANGTQYWIYTTEIKYVSQFEPQIELTAKHAFRASIGNNCDIYIFCVDQNESPYNGIELYIYQTRVQRITPLCYSGYDYNTCFSENLYSLWRLINHMLFDDDSVKKMLRKAMDDFLK